MVIDGGSSKSEVLLLDPTTFAEINCGADFTDAGRLGKVIPDIAGK